MAITPEELILELGPGTDRAVCVQTLVDQLALAAPKAPPHVEPRVAMADTTEDEEKAAKEEKHPHTPYRNPKR